MLLVDHFRRERAAEKGGGFRLLSRFSQVPLLGILLVLPLLIAAGSKASAAGPLVVLEVEVKENTVDGCTACGCRVKGELEPGAEDGWWAVFGLVRPDEEKGWAAVTASSHCGSGPFEAVTLDFRRTVGIPYAILELSATAGELREGDVELEAQLRIQKLSGFDGKGLPTYVRTHQNRVLSFTTKSAALALPFLIPDQRELEAFGVHEVLLEIRAAALEREAVEYGTLSVSAEVPGAEIRLDGGLVGTIMEGESTLLRNVPVGKREIVVRDFSGRESRRQVVVKKEETTTATLEILDLGSAGSPKELTSIGVNPEGYEEYWRSKDRATVVRIPAGEFLMGSLEGKGEPAERPQHLVHLSEFLIDKTEVTWRQFRKFLKAQGKPIPRSPISGTPDHYPVSFILWEEAKGYCEWVGGRLPTEAEWEKAARGTDGRTYPWGDPWDPRCNSISGGLHQVESVGSYPDCLSPYGVLDMSGSMWEWCADRYGESYYAESPPSNPQGPVTGRLHVMRGGAWMSQRMWLRSAHRVKRSPSSRNADHGFRCAQDPTE